MALKDAEMHVVSFLGSTILTAAFFVPILWFAEGKETEGPILQDRQAIEATIAYRKTPQKQPQKKTAQQEVIKPEGVSRDETKKVEQKDEKKDPKIDPKNPFGQFTRPSEDTGAPTTRPEGDFNGNEKGFAPESKGDPFFGRLRGDMNFQFPEIAKASSIPIGCIRLLADGKIQGVTFDPPIGQKGDDDLQTAAEASLAELKKTRNSNPEAVPSHLLAITTKWLCFKFSVSQ
jgi:hypothetical protein